MIIIGEKINGAIPSIKQAIEDHNEELIRERVAAQAAAGADYIDCAPSTAPEIEYDTMVWLIDLIQDVTDLPISIDSPNPLLLKRAGLLPGFDAPDALLTAPETRSSSPVRIVRGEDCQSELRGLYPCGEGAGYAGGILSAAVDGMRCAEAVLPRMEDKT